MAEIDDLINQAIIKNKPDASPEEKTKLQEILSKIVVEGMTIQQAVGMADESFERVYDLARQMYETGNHKQASQMFSLLSTINPQSAKALFGLAACYQQMHKYGEAINVYFSSYYVDLENPLPFFHMADCYLKLNQPENAIFCFGMVMTIAKDNPQHKAIKDKAELLRRSLIEGLELKSTAK